MPKLSPISARALIRILEKQGFQKVHQKGSHVRMEHSNGRKTTIPFHQQLMNNALFLKGDISTHFVQDLVKEEKIEE